jgi:hypothetical protein
MIKSTTLTSCPAYWVAAATHTSPRGKVGIVIVSVLAKMCRTFMFLHAKQDEGAVVHYDQIYSPASLLMAHQRHA